jgi:hypothetical protein
MQYTPTMIMVLAPKASWGQVLLPDGLLLPLLLMMMGAAAECLDPELCVPPMAGRPERSTQ